MIRYDYLWAREERRGRTEGSKDRPCVVVSAIGPTADQPLRAVICAITHTEPPDPAAAIEIPRDVKKQLGLDADRSWMITDEVNLLEWSDPGIVPLPGTDRWSYGFLPRSLAEDLRAALLARAGNYALVKR